mmetsp:Transcript_4451/g.11722  ORF Transcript_4451/g.11722 Transcript_4451/m.11722 type:complete len:412 (+) Transcript_4451:173-1408(+)
MADRLRQPLDRQHELAAGRLSLPLSDMTGFVHAVPQPSLARTSRLATIQPSCAPFFCHRLNVVRPHRASWASSCVRGLTRTRPPPPHDSSTASLGRKTVKVSSVLLGSMTAVIGERGTTMPLSMAVTTTWSTIITQSPSLRPDAAPVEPSSSSTMTLEAESITSPIPILVRVTVNSAVSYESVSTSCAVSSPDCVSLPPTSLRWAATSLSEPVVLRWTSTIRSAQRKSSRVRLDGATRSTVRLEEIMERHCNSEMVSPFLTTCEATSPERKRVADFCLIELSTDILVSPYICGASSSPSALPPPNSRPLVACLKTSVLMPSTTAEISLTVSLASAFRLCTLFLFGLHQSTSRRLSDSQTRRSCGGPSLENFMKMLPALSSCAAVRSELTMALITRPRCSFWIVITAYHAFR